MAGLGKARKKALRDAVALLKSLPMRDMDQGLKKMAARMLSCVHDVAGEKMTAYMSCASEEQYQQVIELLPSAVTVENVEGRHRLRIAIKKWRYRLETVAEVSGLDFETTLETLKTYQTILGKLNDMVAFAALCDDLNFSKVEKKGA
jgi:CHAD domain-containing protein